MKFLAYRFSSVIVLVSLGLVFSACTTTNVESDEEKKKRWSQNQTPTLDLEQKAPDNILKAGKFSKASPTVVSADDRKYRVSLHSNQYPIPMQKIHSWTVHIEHADGRPLENAKVYIHGGMPAHRHGFPSKPRVKKYLGNGNYLIEGMKFSMIGEWEIRVNIKEPNRRDRAVFRITLPQ